MVPNPSLLDNHQEELAEEMAAQGYAVHGDLEFVFLDGGGDVDCVSGG